MDVTWQGILPALMMEMKEDGSLDLPATAWHIEAIIRQAIATRPGSAWQAT